jgi:hypothetical protein
MNTSPWYVARKMQQIGPFSWTQIQQMAAVGMIQPTDMVSPEGMPRWMPASAVPELFRQASAFACPENLREVNTELSAKDNRVLEDLYCRSLLTVDELPDTDDMEELHQEFTRRTGCRLAQLEVHNALRDLERAGRLGGKKRCFGCGKLAPRIYQTLCTECDDRIRGIRVPPGVPREAKLNIGVPNGTSAQKPRFHLNSVDEDPDAYRLNFDH